MLKKKKIAIALVSQAHSHCLLIADFALKITLNFFSSPQYNKNSEKVNIDQKSYFVEHKKVVNKKIT